MLFFMKELEEENIADCYYLDVKDKCYYLGDYTPRGGYSCSEINQLIANLKKSVLKKGSGEYYYKINAIKSCAEYIGRFIEANKNSNIIIIPVPPSASNDNELYDDRMMEIATLAACGQRNAAVYEFVEQVHSTEAVHSSNASRLTPKQLKENYRVVPGFSLPSNIDAVFILDDVLTTGSHFRAIKDMLLEECPHLSNKIYGLFIAKVIR